VSEDQENKPVVQVKLKSKVEKQNKADESGYKLKEAPGTVVEATGRILRGSQQIHIDHYKLKVAKDVFNYAPTEVGDKPSIQMPVPVPQYTEREHCHFFHTYDSSGKKQVKSTAIAGHFHQITVTPQGPNKPPKVECGPAVKEVRKKNKKTHQWEISYAPADDDKDTIEECHVHKVEYLSSEVVTIRSMNMKAIQQEQVEVNKTVLPGVIA